MKYFGKKSLSSVMSVLLGVAWYLAWAFALVALVLGVVIVFHAQFGSPFSEGMAASSQADIRDWERFQSLPLGVQILVLPYFGAVMALVLLVIRKARTLFAGFKNEAVFNQGNVRVIRETSRLVIALSILTFSLGSFLVGVILLLLCEIVKAGAALQEEHDLTV